MVEGQIFKAAIANMSFQPRLLAFRPYREFRWVGGLWFRGLFDGEHVFLIEDQGEQGVLLRQEEYFDGLLVRFLTKMLDTETKAGFEAMNQALKERAEAVEAVVL